MVVGSFMKESRVYNTLLLQTLNEVEVKAKLVVIELSAGLNIKRMDLCHIFVGT